MNKFASFFAVLIATLLYCSAAFATSSQDAASVFVSHFQMGKDLQKIAVAASSRTQTYRMVEATLGAEKARVVVSNEIGKVLPKYQTQWNQNLAKAYANYLTAEELTSLAEQGRNSKYFSKLRSMQPAIGSDMKALSEPILIELVTTALSNVFASLQKQSLQQNTERN